MNAWQAFEVKEAEERVKLVTQFEAWREKERAGLALKRLPDA